jgi:hypothetical protein
MAENNNYSILSHMSKEEIDDIVKFAELIKKCPIPEHELLDNIGLFLTSKNFSRILFFYEIYKRVVTLHGCIAEFGTRWGQNVSVLASLRGIFEPFNRYRKIFAFDTFEGLKGTSPEENESSGCVDGAYSVPDYYEVYLEKILSLQESLNPNPHLKKFEIVKGDAINTVENFLFEHPEVIFSLVIFDMDIYAPTKSVLHAIKKRLIRGSILVFDEIGDEEFPGETKAIEEIFGINNVRLQRMPMVSRLCWFEID